MIVLDTDSFTLHQFGHKRFLERFEAASEAPVISIITEIEALRGRHEALIKAEDGARLIHAQHGLIRTIEHLALAEKAPQVIAFAKKMGRETNQGAVALVFNDTFVLFESPFEAS